MDGAENITINIVLVLKDVGFYTLVLDNLVSGHRDLIEALDVELTSWRY